MAIPTLLVGVLPGYQTLGLAAPILLTLLRMIRGLSVGGEYTTSIVFMVEHAKPGRRGLIGAMGCRGAVGGILAGSATGAVLAAMMSEAALESWGWRIPFMPGLIIGLAGFFLRRGIHEETKVKKAVAPSFLAALPDHRPLLPLMLATAWLSDRIGRRPVLMGATVVGMVAAWPLFWLMHNADPAMVLLGQLGFVLSVGTFVGCQPALMVETVPTEVRYTVIALGYNVTLGVVGGLSPLVATWLVNRTGSDYSPAFMIMGAAAISFLPLLSFRESYRVSLSPA